MSQRKQKKEIHQPDDKLFKVVMEDKENAAQYLLLTYPKLAKELDLSSLKIQREKFSIPNLKVFDADISYKCKFKDSKENLNISFLWENKSQPEKFISIQVGLYLFLKYYKMVKTKGTKLEPIIPLIFYNGKEDWQPKTIVELFQNHPSMKLFKSYLPNFKFHFTDVKKIPQKKLLAIKIAFFKSAMLAMANKHDYNLIKQNYSIIFGVDEKDHLITLVNYIFGIFEHSIKKVQKDINQLENKLQSKIMSTIDMFIEKGKNEGKIEGIQLTLKVIELHKKELPPKEISKQLDIELKTVNSIINSLK